MQETLRTFSSDYFAVHIVIITLQIAILCGNNPLAEIAVMRSNTFGDACYIYVILRRSHIHTKANIAIMTIIARERKLEDRLPISYSSFCVTYRTSHQRKCCRSTEDD